MVLIGLALILADSGFGTGAGSQQASHAGSASRTAASTQSTSKSYVPANPLGSKAMHRWIDSRSGKVSVAVEDLGSGHEWLWNKGARDWTASIIKLDILETYLHRTPLADAENATAVGMIEASDNDDATDLWDIDGGPGGIAAYNGLAGLTQTRPNVAWGETTTSAADQIKLLQQLAKPSKLLSKAAQRYALYLMENIDPGENWGVTGGVPSSVTVALKNGWVPLNNTGTWEINSVGWVHGDGRDYLIAVLTAWNPSEEYGINTIDGVSSLIYKSLTPPKKA